jgi:hypothetical protein
MLLTVAVTVPVPGKIISYMGMDTRCMVASFTYKWGRIFDVTFSIASDLILFYLIGKFFSTSPFNLP